MALQASHAGFAGHISRPIGAVVGDHNDGTMVSGIAHHQQGLETRAEQHLFVMRRDKHQQSREVRACASSRSTHKQDGGQTHEIRQRRQEQDATQENEDTEYDDHTPPPLQDVGFRSRLTRNVLSDVVILTYKIIRVSGLELGRLASVA
jgi:hypothetical protein